MTRIFEREAEMFGDQQIVFVEGRGGRRAALASCGLEVWEVVAT